MTAAKDTADKVASDRALAILAAQASGQRVLATEVHAGAQALADSHARTAELLDQLAERAPEIWGDAVVVAKFDAERLAELAANGGEQP